MASSGPDREAVQAFRGAEPELGVVRSGVSDAAQEGLVSAATGYLSSLSGRHEERQGLTEALEHLPRILIRYLESRGPDVQLSGTHGSMSGPELSGARWHLDLVALDRHRGLRLHCPRDGETPAGS